MVGTQLGKCSGTVASDAVTATQRLLLATPLRRLETSGGTVGPYDPRHEGMDTVWFVPLRSSFGVLRSRIGSGDTDQLAVLFAGLIVNFDLGICLLQRFKCPLDRVLSPLIS